MRAILLTLLLLMTSSIAIRVFGQSQTLEEAEKITLGSGSNSEETAKAEARFLELIEAQTRQLNQLRDSLTQLLEIHKSTIPTAEGEVSREDIEIMLEMYNSMLRTNPKILGGKARIIGVL